ncbi:hypothetical protein DFH07DRAFT_114424 [Mycena maculata]|uniref:F-box domain-containing protein n=1 Tax=Mycena maculata TaxID=230809 RepID=A0AAD7I4S1_9AGAR|nr:hypothetical protein DFH07DRAFT_114424 [Mycena maculata]
MSGMAALPPELFDIIIGHARDDICDLATCSLICRSWLASARYHIFQGNPISIRPGNVQTFIQLIAHPLSTLPPYIQSLELLSLNSPEGSFDSQWLDPIIGILANLPCVTEILIENIHWGRMNPSTKSALLTGFRALTHLELWAAQFDSVSHLLQLVCSKPLLQILSFDDLGWEDPSFETPANSSQCVPGTLHSLRLSNCYKRDILDWLTSHVTIPPIHHIQLGSVYPEDTHSIGRFLKRLGSDLLTLQLEFSSLDAGGDAEDFCSQVDLAHNSALRTVILDKFIHYSVYQFSSAVGWIPELISRIPSLREVSFGIAIRDVEELHPQEDPIDWDALDDIFCHPRFPHLRALRFWVSGNVEFDEAISAISLSLPRSNQQRILRFHRGTPRLLD